MANESKSINLFINTKGASASIKELQKDYRTLYNELAKLEPESDEFIQKSKEFKKVAERLDEVKKAAKGVSDESKGLSNFKSIFLGTFTADAAMQAGKAIIGFFKDSITASMEFKKSLSELSSITGATGSDLQFLADAAKDTAKEHGVLAKDVVETYKLIGGAKPELLENKEALAAITEQAIILSQAAGMELPAAAKSLTDALNQFNAPAEEANRYINALAAGSKEGAAEIPDITEALLKFGVAANSANVSIEESTALIETLADKGLKGAEAGTALRNVLAKMSAPDSIPKETRKELDALGVDLAKVSNITLPLNERLDELSKIQSNASLLTKVFGLENKNAGQILLENTTRFNELTKAVTGTNTATEQAAINMDNLAGDTEKLTALIDAEMADLGDSFDGVLRGAVQFATDVLKNTEPLKEVFSSIASVVGSVWDSFKHLLSAIIPFNSSANTTGVVMKVIATAFNILFTPTKILAAGVTMLHDAFNILLNKGKEVLNFFGADFKLDPNASIENLKNNLQKNGEEITGSYKKIWQDNKTANDKSNKDIEAANKAAAEQQKRLLEEQHKQEKAMRDQKLKEEQDRQIKLAEEREKQRKQLEKDIEAADKNIHKLLQKSFSDSLEDRIYKLQNQAQEEIALVVGTEEQKALQIELINENLQKDIDKLREEARKKEADAEKKALAEREKEEKEYRDKKYNAEVAANEMQLIMAGNDQDKILEVKLQRLELEHDRELENKNLTEEEKALIDEKFIEEYARLKEEHRARELEQIKTNVSDALAFLNEGVSIISDFLKIKSNKELQGIQNEKDARIASLDAEFAAKRISQEQYDKERKKAEEKAAKDTAAIKTKQAEDDKKAAIAQATISLALGIIKAIPNPLTVAFAALTGGAALAKIIATPIPKFAEGGSTKRAMRGGLPMGRTAMPTVMHGGYVDQPLIAEFGEEGPEYVVPNWMLQDSRIADMVSVMEAIRSGGSMRGFAVGGSTIPADIAAPSSGLNSSSQDTAVFIALVAEVQGLRQDVNSWNTRLEATINYDTLKAADDLVNQIKTDGNL